MRMRFELLLLLFLASAAFAVNTMVVNPPTRELLVVNQSEAWTCTAVRTGEGGCPYSSGRQLTLTANPGNIIMYDQFQNGASCSYTASAASAMLSPAGTYNITCSANPGTSSAPVSRDFTGYYHAEAYSSASLQATVLAAPTTTITPFSIQHGETVTVSCSFPLTPAFWRNKITTATLYTKKIETGQSWVLATMSSETACDQSSANSGTVNFQVTQNGTGMYAYYCAYAYQHSDAYSVCVGQGGGSGNTPIAYLDSADRLLTTEYFGLNPEAYPPAYPAPLNNMTTTVNTTILLTNTYKCEQGDCGIQNVTLQYYDLATAAWTTVSGSSSYATLTGGYANPYTQYLSQDGTLATYWSLKATTEVLAVNYRVTVNSAYTADYVTPNAVLRVNTPIPPAPAPPAPPGESPTTTPTPANLTEADCVDTCISNAECPGDNPYCMFSRRSMRGSTCYVMNIIEYNRCGVSLPSFNSDTTASEAIDEFSAGAKGFASRSYPFYIFILTILLAAAFFYVVIDLFKIPLRLGHRR